MSRRVSLTGISTDAPAGDARKQYNPRAEILMPSGSIRSPVPPLKSLNLSQAILDGLAVLFSLFFLAALFGSLPLAVALMVLGVF